MITAHSETVPATLEAASAAPAEVRSRAADYLDMAKPRLTALAVCASLVSYLLVGGDADSRLLLLAVGAALVSAGAAYLNQFLEVEYDALMVRTRDRGLPSGRVAEEEAVAAGVLASLVGSIILTHLVHPLAGFTGLAILLGYTLVYTPLKRLTTLNTYAGAVVGALPVILGVVAARPSVGVTGWVLFAIVFVWQLPHFWSIAWIHREDYSRAGFQMLSRNDPDGRLTGLYALATSLVLIPVSLSASFFRVAGPTYFVGATVLGLGMVLASARMAWSPSDARARSVFHTSLVYLPALFALMLIDKVGL